jgi:hypothetical protein
VYSYQSTSPITGEDDSVTEPLRGTVVDYPPQQAIPCVLAYPPAELPTAFKTSVAQMSDGGRRILLEIHDATGVTLKLLRPEEATALADQLRRDAAQARSGLVLSTSLHT